MKPWVIALLVVGALILAGGGALYAISSNSQEATSAQQAAQQAQQDQRFLVQQLKQSCREAGDPVRHVLIDTLRDDIANTHQEILQSKALPASFFPSIPPKRFAQLQRQSRRRQHAQQNARHLRIKQLQNVPSCSERYAHGH